MDPQDLDIVRTGSMAAMHDGCDSRGSQAEHETPAMIEVMVKARQKNWITGLKRKLNNVDGDEGEDGDLVSKKSKSGETAVSSLSLSEDQAEADRQERQNLTKETEDIFFRNLTKDLNVSVGQTRRPPTDIIRYARQWHEKGSSYRRALESLPTTKPTPEQIRKLQQDMLKAPNYLCRTASLTPGKRFCPKSATNGFTSQRVMIPAAAMDVAFGLHGTLFDLTLGELIWLIAKHLMWDNPKCDELLSHSIDFLFNMMHGLNRYNEGQGGSTLQFFDTRQAKTKDGKKAAFIHALRLYEEFEVPLSNLWSGPNQNALKSRKFTQEFLSHGIVINEDTRFMQAPVDKLIANGLYEIFPELRIPQGERRTGLYGGLVLYRTIGYPPNAAAKARREIYSYDDCAREVSLTTEYLQKVRKLALCFMANGSQSSTASKEPHLHIFLSFLTFYKRQRRDPVLKDWIDARYTGEDVTDIYEDDTGEVIPDFTHIASNLPGVMQYLDLLRDAADIKGVRRIPDTVVETQNALTGEVYAEVDAERQRNEVKSRPYEKKEKKAKEDSKARMNTMLAGAQPLDEDEEEDVEGDADSLPLDRTDSGEDEDGAVDADPEAMQAKLAELGC